MSRQLHALIMSLLLALTGPALSGLGSHASAHPFHTTAADVDWNPRSSRFEVSLQLPGMYLEDELSRLNQRPVNLERSKDREEMLRTYITERFAITESRHSTCRIHWVGMEVDLRYVWAYFEVELLPDEGTEQRSPEVLPANDSAAASAAVAIAAGPVAGVKAQLDGTEVDANRTGAAQPLPQASGFDNDTLVVSSRILTDLYPDQLNLVTIHAGRRSGSVQLTPAQPEQSLLLKDATRRTQQAVQPGR